MSEDKFQQRQAARGATAWGKKMIKVWKLIKHYHETGVIHEPTVTAFWHRAGHWGWGFYDALRRAYEKGV